MEQIYNSSYLICVGTLIGFERKKRFKESKVNEEFIQISFCEGICNVTTYRKIELSQMEVKIEIYEKLLKKLKMKMCYHHLNYNKINQYINDLGEAIIYYDTTKIYRLIDSINKCLILRDDDIYERCIKLLMDIIYRYYHDNLLPSYSEFDQLSKIHRGFPDNIKDIMIDLEYNYVRRYMVCFEDHRKFAQSLNLYHNNFIMNKINFINFLLENQNYDEAILLIDQVILELKRKKSYIRILDLYDLRLIANHYMNPKSIKNRIVECNEEMDNLIKKVPKEERNSIGLIRAKAQHYYITGNILFRNKEYLQAYDLLIKSYQLDSANELFCKIILFHIVDKLKDCIFQEDFLHLESINVNHNKYDEAYQYFLYKYKNLLNYKLLLKYLNDHILFLIEKDDELLIIIFSYELNFLAKKTKNYRILQRFMEKVQLIG